MLSTTLVLLLVCVFVSLFVCCVSSEESVKAQIETLFLPEDCTTDSVKSKQGDKALFHYTGTIHDSSLTGEPGYVFETTSKGRPLRVMLGSGSLVKGLEDSLYGMCVGEKRRVVVPPSLGYGKQGMRTKRVFIPGQATLQFDIEFVGYYEKKTVPNVFQAMDKNNDGKIVYEEMEYWFQHDHPSKYPSIPRGVWEKDDVNQDGMITWEEFTGPKGHDPIPLQANPPKQKAQQTQQQEVSAGTSQQLDSNPLETNKQEL